MLNDWLVIVKIKPRWRGHVQRYFIKIQSSSLDELNFRLERINIPDYMIIERKLRLIGHSSRLLKTEKIIFADEFTKIIADLNGKQQ